METSSNEKTYALFSNAANQKLAAKLEQEGAKVFLFAPVIIRKIKSPGNAAIIKNNLCEFDWIVFPDIFAVECFLEILEENGADLFALDALQVLAFGEAVADRLRFVQVHADVITHSIKTETIFSALSAYLGKDDFSGSKFLIPTGNIFDHLFCKKLEEKGADVTEIAVCKIEIPERNTILNVKALLKGGAIDEFIFTSPEDVLSLKYHFAQGSLSENLSGIKILGTNERTIQTLRENNLRAHYFQPK